MIIPIGFSVEWRSLQPPALSPRRVGAVRFPPCTARGTRRDDRRSAVSAELGDRTHRHDESGRAADRLPSRRLVPGVHDVRDHRSVRSGRARAAVARRAARHHTRARPRSRDLAVARAAHAERALVHPARRPRRPRRVAHRMGLVPGRRPPRPRWLERCPLRRRGRAARDGDTPRGRVPPRAAPRRRHGPSLRSGSRAPRREPLRCAGDERPRVLAAAGDDGLLLRGRGSLAQTHSEPALGARSGRGELR